MNDDERELALNCYGYGHWDAPYWFIGPEQGKGKLETKDLAVRAEAFRKLNRDGLCDCRAFHIEIKDETWHFKEEGIRHKDTPPLQSTWKSLILLLMAYQEKPTTDETRIDYQREYQRKCLGSSDGETCVIELSGLPAKNFEESQDRERGLSGQERAEFDDIRQKRIEFIHNKMLICKPQFVVVYGASQKRYWIKFWKDNAVSVSRSGDVFKLGSTTIAFTLHAVRSPGNQYWINWGTKLRGAI